MQLSFSLNGCKRHCEIFAKLQITSISVSTAQCATKAWPHSRSLSVTPGAAAVSQWPWATSVPARAVSPVSTGQCPRSGVSAPWPGVMVTYHSPPSIALHYIGHNIHWSHPLLQIIHTLLTTPLQPNKYSAQWDIMGVGGRTKRTKGCKIDIFHSP